MTVTFTTTAVASAGNAGDGQRRVRLGHSPVPQRPARPGCPTPALAPPGRTRRPAPATEAGAGLHHDGAGHAGRQVLARSPLRAVTVVNVYLPGGSPRRLAVAAAVTTGETGGSAVTRTPAVLMVSFVAESGLERANGQIHGLSRCQEAGSEPRYLLRLVRIYYAFGSGVSHLVGKHLENGPLVGVEILGHGHLNSTLRSPFPRRPFSFFIPIPDNVILSPVLVPVATRTLTSPSRVGILTSLRAGPL